MKTHHHFVLVHGFMGSGLVWSSFAHQLKKTRPNIITHTPTLWGHGSRGDIWFFQSEEEMDSCLCDDLEKQISVTEPVIIMAHSFGLRPTLKLIDKKPSLAKALIIEDASPSISQQGSQWIRDILINTPAAFESRTAAKIYLEKTYSPILARFLMTNMKTSEDQTTRWRFHAPSLLRILDLSLQQPLWKEWDNLKIPILLLTGNSQESYVKESVLTTMLEKQPLMQHFRCEQSGHWIHSENPSFLIHQINQFISQIKE